VTAKKRWCLVGDNDCTIVRRWLEDTAVHAFTLPQLAIESSTTGKLHDLLELAQDFLCAHDAAVPDGTDEQWEARRQADIALDMAISDVVGAARWGGRRGEIEWPE
jgi:hypothetical protein